MSSRSPLVSLWPAFALFFALVPAVALRAQDGADAVSRAPTAPKTAPDRVAAAHLVISFAEAERAFPDVERTKENARKLAEEALVMARRPDVEFVVVVRKYSDDKQGAEVGGGMGVLRRSQLRAEFDALGEALWGMEIGQVSEIVESPFGFHILTRTPIVEYSASHILIQYKGSSRAKETVTRTKEQALQLASDVAKEAAAPGADFPALAKKYSDGPSGPAGGRLGIFPAGRMVPAFDEALGKMKIGEVSAPVETDFGFHVIKREKIDRVAASHILIQYKGSSRAKETVTRTKEEALELASKVAKEAAAEGADFAVLAKRYSDGPSAPEGGDLGEFGRGKMTPPFEKAAFALKVGGVSAAVETGFGYHIIKRTK